jgi:predicted nucleotidyltransferase
MNTPVPGRAPDPAIDDLAQRLGGEPDLRVAIVFGAVASGEAGFDSDVDVAVMMERRMSGERRLALLQLIEAATGRPVDLVDLRDAGVAVMRAALNEGRVLVCRDPRDLDMLRSKMVTDAEDFLPGLERLLAERRRSWIG